MKCPKCQSDNREDVKFCEQCGAGMELECPNCKARIPLGKKFCGECGQFLSEPSAAPPEPTPSSSSERKHITVLFSYLSGYTAMSEKLDPEEVKGIMDQVFGKIREVVARNDGIIEKFIGDAVVAFLGIPHAHEDDPVSRGRQGHPMSLLSSKKFVHNNSNGLAISALFTAHLSSRLLPRSFHMVGESPT
jgi:hypothetical protein